MLTKNTVFVVFQANILNENEILAIIGAKYVEKFTIFDQKRLFLRYLNYISNRPILAVQIRPRFVIAETWKMVHFGSRLKCTPLVLPKLA